MLLVAVATAAVLDGIGNSVTSIDDVGIVVFWRTPRVLSVKDNVWGLSRVA